MSRSQFERTWLLYANVRELQLHSAVNGGIFIVGIILFFRLEDPDSGFVAELRTSHGFRIPEDADIQLVFLSNRETRFSPYAYDCFQKLYEAVSSRERFNGGRKFSCQFFQRILGVAEGERARFILRSFQVSCSLGV